MKRVMKGEAVDDLTQIRFPKLASVKIDGFRCVLKERPYTTSMKPFPNMLFNRSLSGALPSGECLDGEVVVGKRKGKGVLGRTSSGLTRTDGNPDWRYWVFDAPGPGRFEDRYRRAREVVAALHSMNPKLIHRVRLVKQQIVESIEELQAFIEQALADGYEGVMVRDPEAGYKEGKSTINQQGMLKIKPFETCEARITGYYEEMENTNERKQDATGKSKRSSSKDGKIPKGTLGGFTGVDLVTGVHVRVGGGFTKEQRYRLWKIRDDLIGKFFTYGKQVVGEKDKPRHPVFHHLRPGWDIEGV